ncbi:hypothetical protein AK812_SmicGene2836 [Symbiodinium microadriaticum]|uniref:Uncharacterized protein n=1 Tax=Symbiodinium microadriaticum TaxID=2951 RepID=A0A1Q9F0N3_SYMMI|nr:hypothetical protein AK812_SmicGene2836 [Symbiodinium microadriaticum]CAE7343193.1 unnamed protein product [Symbiodinium sp. KB8]CAE7881620.1 unnamed protein product [Symbiodinium microadriaticum]
MLVSRKLFSYWTCHAITHRDSSDCKQLRDTTPTEAANAYTRSAAQETQTKAPLVSDNFGSSMEAGVSRDLAERMRLAFYNDYMNQLIKAGPAETNKLVYVLEQILEQIKVAGVPGGGELPKELEDTVQVIRDVCEGLHVLCQAGSPYKPDSLLQILNHTGTQDIMISGLKMAIQGGWTKACNDILRTAANLKTWLLSASAIETKVAEVKAAGSDFDFACMVYIMGRLETSKKDLRPGTTARAEELLLDMAQKATAAILGSEIKVGQISYEDRDIKTVQKAWTFLPQNAEARKLQQWHAQAGQALAMQEFLDACKVDSFEDAALFELIKSFPKCKAALLELQDDDDSMQILRGCISPLFKWLSLNAFGCGVSRTTAELQEAVDFVHQMVVSTQHPAKDWLLKNVLVADANVKVRHSQDAYTKLGTTLQERVERDRRRNMLQEYMRAVQAYKKAAKDVEQCRASNSFQDGEDIDDERLRTLNFDEKAPLDVSEFIDALKLVCHNFKEEIKEMASALQALTGDLCNPDMPGYWRAGLSSDCTLADLKQASVDYLKNFKGGKCLEDHKEYQKALKEIAEFQTTFGAMAGDFEIMEELRVDKEAFETKLVQARVTVSEGIIILAVQSQRSVAQKLLSDEAPAIAGGLVPENMIHPILVQEKNRMLE